MAPPQVRPRAKTAAAVKRAETPSITELKRAIPAECFTASTATSLYYTARNAVLAAALFLAARALSQYHWAVWPVYWLAQGTTMWGVFVDAHSCGHASYSPSHWVNEAVGLVLSTTILVPYTPWKESHRHHHKHTGDIDQDEIFYPTRQRANAGWLSTDGYFGLGLSWFAYLVVGYWPRKVSHINPQEPMFARHRGMAVASVLSWWLAVAATGTAVSRVGLVPVFCYYLAPLFVMASHLVVCTFLHHQFEGSEWSSGDQWEYTSAQLRGTIDRPSYGEWLGEWTLQIGNYHVLHHLFPRIPHYHLAAASKALDEAYPGLRQVSDKPVPAAFVDGFRTFAASFNGIGDATVWHVPAPPAKSS